MTLGVIEGIVPPHPVKMARQLSMSEAERRWAVVRGALQFANLLRLSVPRLTSASWVTTSLHSTLDLMVRTLGKSPTSAFRLSSLFSDDQGCLREVILRLPARGIGKNLSADTMCCSL